jgi:uncharacterized protein
MTTPLSKSTKFVSMKIQLIVFLILASPFRLFAADPSLAERLQKGLFEEEANHNLDAAISEYTKIINESDQQRRIVSTALTRLAECYSKLGKEDEVRKITERLARDFSEFQPSGFRQRLNTIVATVPSSDYDQRLSPEKAIYFERLGRLLENSPDLLDAPATNSQTFLQFAATVGDVDLIDFMLKRGAKPDRAPTTDAYPPLFRAVQGGHKRAAELLIKGGANLKYRDTEGRTALHLAAQRGYIEISDLLLKNGAEVNALDSSRQTPLYGAAHTGQADEVSYLIKQGAGVNARDLHGTSPVLWAVFSKNAATVTALIEAGADVNASAPGLFNAALQQRSSEILSVLLERGADPNLQNPDGTTPLMQAAENNRFEIAKILLEKNANPNILDKNGGTALRRALNLEFTQIAEVLLEYGANPNLRDHNGRTPLHYNCGFGQGRVDKPEKVRLLLAHKADPNIADDEGMTPLLYAITADSFDVVQLLLKANADPKVTDKNGNSALTYAKSRGTEGQRIQRLLLQSLAQKTNAVPDKPNP